MSEFYVVERLDKIDLGKILSSLEYITDRFSISVPLSGYDDVDYEKILQCAKLLDVWQVGERTIGFDVFSVLIKDIRFCKESLEQLLAIGASHQSWSWIQGLPEDIILYRKGSDLVLFESYQVDKMAFAILNSLELNLFLSAIGGKEGRKIISLEKVLSDKNLPFSNPRLLNSGEAYLDSVDSKKKT